MLETPSAHRSLPAGTVTFMFTDIEGSTKLWEAHPESMATSLARHDDLMRAAIAGANGYVFNTAGDAFCAAFAMAPDALSAVLAAQRAIVLEPWPETTPIKVRMALHTGTVESRSGDYFGPALNRVARLLSTGHGGQTLLSQTTYDLVRDTLPAAVSLHDLGAHKLKDLARAEQVFEIRHPDLPRGFPPIKSLSTHPNNLPQQLTSFVGRDKEIAEVRGLLANDRLLTLTGCGGSGKTRLALQVAADTLEQFSDGVWLVELAALGDPGLVPQLTAGALGLQEEPGKPMNDTLAEFLGSKRLLLLLDNCEHLLDGCAKVADTLLRRCPHLKILATSREVLAITGERTYRVPSLSLPDRRQAPTPLTLTLYEAVRLFIDRALLVRPDFQVTNQNAPALASLCHHLDGIPLAIELAAARVRSMSVEEIDGKLDQRFRLLTGGSRTALPRQQTLRSLIDWSYDLLNPSEQQLLQRLSIFAGGWTLAAAEQICVGESVARGNILDLTTSLADKSLVVMAPDEGQSRYRLLETLRQYARDRLTESGTCDVVRQRHNGYYLALALEIEPRLSGAEQAEWLRWLDDEHENLRACLEFSIEDARSLDGLRLCGALFLFWVMRGFLSEGREWCARVLAIAGAEARTAERANALNTAGALAFSQSDYPDARARWEEALAIRRELGDRKGTARLLNNLGVVAFDQGDYDSARALHEETFAIFRELGDTRGVASALNNLANLAIEQRDFSSGKALHDEALSVGRANGDEHDVANTLRNMGLAASYQSDYPTARALFEETLAITRGLGDRNGVAAALGNLAGVAYVLGDYPQAKALYRESLLIQRELGSRREITYSLEGLAEVAAAFGNLTRAARNWGAAERLREEIRSPLSPNERPRYEQRVAAARAPPTDNSAFERAWQRGRALTLEQAVELALLDDNVEQG